MLQTVIYTIMSIPVNVILGTEIVVGPKVSKSLESAQIEAVS